MMTVTGGKSYEQIRSHYVNQVRRASKTSDGRSLSQTDARVFASTMQRQPRESFFGYVKRRQALSKLSLEDKQQYVNAEKQRLKQEQERQQALQDRFLKGSRVHSNQKTSTKTKKSDNVGKAEIGTIRQGVNTALNNRLNSTDQAYFERLASKQQAEKLLTYLKRRRKLHNLSTEEKQQLVSEDRALVKEEQNRQQALLDNYLALTDTSIQESVQSSTNRKMTSQTHADFEEQMSESQYHRSQNQGSKRKSRQNQQSQKNQRNRQRRRTGH